MSTEETLAALKEFNQTETWRLIKKALEKEMVDMMKQIMTVDKKLNDPAFTMRDVLLLNFRTLRIILDAPERLIEEYTDPKELMAGEEMTPEDIYRFDKNK